jgi:hypothetical protein
MIRVRVDDFPGTKPEEFHKHNLQNFKEFDKILRTFTPEYLLGVIPGYLTREQESWLVDQKHIRCGMHGVVHSEKHKNEFEGMDEKGIVSCLLAARNVMNRLEKSCHTYMPPHNVFDRNTVRACHASKFKNITGGPESTLSEGEIAPLRYLFSQHPYGYGRSDELLTRGAVPWLKSQSDVILTLHWTWELNIGLTSLVQFLDVLRGNFGKFEGQV